MSDGNFRKCNRCIGLLGHPERVRLCDHVEFGHNYNAVTRKAIYELFNETFALNADVNEKPFGRKSAAELSVWDANHVRPVGGENLNANFCSVGVRIVKVKLAAYSLVVRRTRPD